MKINHEGFERITVTEILLCTTGLNCNTILGTVPVQHTYHGILFQDGKRTGASFMKGVIKGKYHSLVDLTHGLLITGQSSTMMPGATECSAIVNGLCLAEPWQSTRVPSHCAIVTLP